MKVKTTEPNSQQACSRKRSTIGLKASTKNRLDQCRAPGQCYDGFIQQMVDLWVKSQGNSRN